MKWRDDPNQTLIDWGNPPAHAATPAYADPVKLVAETPPPTGRQSCLGQNGRAAIFLVGIMQTAENTPKTPISQGDE
jgi:hypothetical protein